MAGCDRLLHPSVAAGADRVRHRRLIAVLLFGPFLFAAAAAPLFIPAFGTAMALAVVCTIFAGSFLATASVSATGDDRAAGGAALAIAAAGGGLLVATGGGPASPLALLAVAPFIEAHWISGTRRAAIAGGAAGIAMLAMQAALSSAVAAPAAPEAWHWIAVLAYLASVFARLAATGRVEAPAGRAGVAAEALLDGVVLTFARSGEVADASDEARAVLGLAPELLLGNGLFDRIHVADRIAYLAAIADLREGAARRRCELRVRLPRAAGEGIAENFRPFRLDLAAPAPAAEFVGLLSDQGEAAELRALVASARTMADGGEIARNRFLATVSHELRTPLNAIIGFSDMMLEGMCGPVADARQREYVGIIRDSGNHLLDVVNAILDVSKIESGAYDVAPEPFRFREVAEMCRSMMALQAETKGVAFDVQVAPTVGEIVADRRSVRQMIINLLSNAIKFTPAGGRVTLSAHRLGSRIHFQVSDTGIGIEAADLDRLGEPFAQVQNDYTRQFEGTGLGLSLVKGLVRLHKGTMTIESAPGAGTTVAISLPADPGRVKAHGEIVPIASMQKRDDRDATLRKIA
jgi:cell cycle sensor histidine kinase DivJ